MCSAHVNEEGTRGEASQGRAIGVKEGGRVESRTGGVTSFAGSECCRSLGALGEGGVESEIVVGKSEALFIGSSH